MQPFDVKVAAHELLIIGKLDCMPLSKTSAELLFNERCQRSSTPIISCLSLDEVTEIFGSEQFIGIPCSVESLTGAHPGNERLLLLLKHTLQNRNWPFRSTRLEEEGALPLRSSGPPPFDTSTDNSLVDFLTPPLADRRATNDLTFI